MLPFLHKAEGRGAKWWWKEQDLDFKFVQGHDFPEDLSGIDLVIHCGACMFTSREVMARQLRCGHQGVPFTNYGVAIAYCFGILERALRPFPESLAAYLEARELRS